MTCKYILFIEEAHNIIGRTGEARPSEENADPKAYATEFICRMMAECGGYDVGIGIIDQLPSALSPAVMKHVGSLTLLRETHEEDRESGGSAMLASKAQKENLVPHFISFTTMQPSFRRPGACRCRSTDRAWPSTHRSIQ